MRVLLVGYSQIAQKRVLPALARMPCVTSIDIASRTSSSSIQRCEQLDGQVYEDYQTALSESAADLVYVSVVNSAHACWVGEALKKGLHVIVDKPAFTSMKDATELVELAERSGLCLAESNVYAYHPQIQLARDAFSDAGSRPTRLTATFSFPPLHSANFRYRRELGGGALWDLGPYAATPGRVFLGEEPCEVVCRVCTRSEKGGVDTSFSVLAVYPEGRSMVGHFGFDTEYRNHLHVLGPSVSVDIDRVFTTPADMENEIWVRKQNNKDTLKAPAADSFLVFLRAVVSAIQSGSYHVFARDLLTDASVLHRMRIAAREE